MGKKNTFTFLLGQLQFASAYFKNTKRLINSLTDGGNGFGGEGEITKADLYLLGFIVLESRHG